MITPPHIAAAQAEDRGNRIFERAVFFAAVAVWFAVGVML